MSERREAVEQAKFCQQMLNRIVEDVENSEPHPYYNCPSGYTRIRDHLTHLRRELLKLSKMVGGE